MKINIILPYNEAGKYYKKWANEEKDIDFINEKEKAMRCTVCFSCCELETYFEKMGFLVSVSEEKDENSINIIYKITDNDIEEFDIIRDENDITLYGYGRRGILYSGYELLEIQGIRWYSASFEYVPQNEEFIFPETKHYKYDMEKGRGFHFEDLLNESEGFILWMARNRLSIHACHIHSKKFQEKLCMRFETGGHIFEKILNPLNVEEDGRLYIDAHKDWYGQRDEEITVENAVKVQFCVSNNELLDKLAETVIKKVNTDWKNEEIISLDGFDTWGKSCNCEKCRKVGNGSDQNLKFISHIRTRMNEAIKKGRMRENVKMSFCIYEGTNTMEPPQNPVPDNLIVADDRGLFCPILRCYKHYLFEDCERNNRYKDCLEGWMKTGLSISMLEYYNVSKYEDLSILYSDKIYNDIRYYIKCGVSSMMYMHVFLKDWGVRTLNHYLMAVVSRDAKCDIKSHIKKYFSDMYGRYASEAEKIYEKIEEATVYIASWRAWFDGSVLTYLMDWDGKKPDKPIKCDNHLKSSIVKEGKKTVSLLSEALEGFRKIRNEELGSISYENFKVTAAALNPVEQAKLNSGSQFLDKINEDIRGIKYTKDTFELMTLMAEYYEALYKKSADLDEIFEKIKVLGETMSEYTYSVVFQSYAPEFEVRDALKRTQLKQLYYRIIASRNENK